MLSNTLVSVRLVLCGSAKRGMAFLQPPLGLRGFVRPTSKTPGPAGMTNNRTLVSSHPLDPEQTGALQERTAKNESPMSVSGARTGRSGFRIESERELFRRHQTVWERNVRFPNGKLVSFDVLGNQQSNFQSVFVFPFDSAERSVTVLKEYSPGVNDLQLSFVAGMFESKKHSSLEQAARAELSEEAHLKGGKLIQLSKTHDGVSADKYSRNKFHFFLCLDSERDDHPREKDTEEWITIVPGYSLSEVRRMILGGRFNTPSSLLGMLALDELRRMGHE